MENIFENRFLLFLANSSKKFKFSENCGYLKWPSYISSKNLREIQIFEEVTNGPIHFLPLNVFKDIH